MRATTKETRLEQHPQRKREENMSKGTQTAQTHTAVTQDVVFMVKVGNPNNKGRGPGQMAGPVRSRAIAQEFIDSLPESERTHCEIQEKRVAHSLKQMQEFAREATMAKLSPRERLLLGLSS
jgi:hypothetical protein